MDAEEKMKEEELLAAEDFGDSKIAQFRQTRKLESFLVSNIQVILVGFPREALD